MTETLDLARRSDFSFGQTQVRPSLRIISGPSGSATAEPRVMQVLLALHDAEGGVLSRDQLLEICWGGVIVGDDAINRTIAEIRRIIKETGAEFEIETIPRVGYRFVASERANPKQALAGPRTIEVDRRRLILAGSATAAVMVAGGGWYFYSRRNGEIDALIEKGRLAQATGVADANKRAEIFFRQALELDERRADTWGWLARVLEDPALAREAAQRALELNRREANARAVLAVQSRDLTDWYEWENELLAILEDDPDNTLALGYLSHFYQSVGRSRDNWRFGERHYRLEPFNPHTQHRRAFRHWIFQKVPEADNILDQSLQLWPRNDFVWNARILIYAFTGRARAAMSFLEDAENRPASLTAPSIESWRAALRALESRSSADIANAISVCTENAALAPGLAANALMTFSYLGELDHAYRVADGLFLGRGSVVQKKRGEGIRDTYSAPNWGRTQSLFIPATAKFRADERFTALCEQMGHAAYWKKRGIWPDPFVRGSLKVPA